MPNSSLRAKVLENRVGSIRTLHRNTTLDVYPTLVKNAAFAPQICCRRREVLPPRRHLVHLHCPQRSTSPSPSLSCTGSCFPIPPRASPCCRSSPPCAGAPPSPSDGAPTL